MRETAARIAASLTGERAARSRLRSAREGAVLTEHVAVGRSLYRVRGELLEQSAAPPIVLVVAERDPDTFPSYDELLEQYRLTHTEARVAVLLAERMSNREIAQELHVTMHTARRHTEQVLLKLGIKGRTAVRRELLRCARRSEVAPSGTKSGAAPAQEVSRPVAAHAVTDEGPRHGRAEGRERASRERKESIVALLAGEADRRAVRDALNGDTELHFVARPVDLRAPWPGGTPTAVLVELAGEAGDELEHALEKLRRTEPTMPIWAYSHVEHSAVPEVVRLAARGLIADVITPHDDMAARLRVMPRESRAWSETAAQWGVWEKCVEPDAREIVAACIEASVGTKTVRDLARHLNRSPRALRRQVTQMGLPAVHRVLLLCRLLRAMYRLDQRGGSIKVIASELGFSSVHALAMQLHRHTGLYLSGARDGSHFADLSALVQAELSALPGRVL